jgi:hypothetical protein
MKPMMQHAAASSKSRVFLTACALAGAIGMASGPAWAQSFVVVNGQLMSPAQVVYLESLHCGPIPDGNYLYDPGTGAWAFANDVWVRGHIGDNCYAPRRRPSLSERRMLYRPGEILSGR